VEPGGFESKDTNTQLKSAFRVLGPRKLICRISLSAQQYRNLEPSVKSASK